MIKHRFIIRGADDFKIFAAIPCESQVLTWKKWMRPPDWRGLRALGDQLLHILTKLLESLRPGREAMEELSGGDLLSTREDDLSRVGVIAGDDFKEDRHQQAERMRQAETTYEVGVETLQSLLVDLESADFTARVCAIQAAILLCAGDDGGAHELLALVRADTEDAIVRYQQVDRALYRAAPSSLKRILKCYDDLLGNIASVQMTRKELVTVVQKVVSELLSSDPLPDTPCPAGTPFAVYTIEFKDSVFNIVEGCAWVAARPKPPREVIDKAVAVLGKESIDRLARGVIDDKAERVATALTDTVFAPTDDEKRVCEIVTQMLVERGLNPKAETRIPVVEADAKDAHHVREAERRDRESSRAKVRTIKFHVSPPRYLREAAERILSSPRKAHWVIGHWRNQPYGAGRQEHRRQWIKPHIRGLGEAGAVVVRVAASDEEVAATK